MREIWAEKQDNVYKDVTELQFADYYKPPKADEDIYVHPSHYDYSLVAEAITKGCNTDYEKIRTIYKWLCDNIAYDTDYEIYHADQCYDERKGVCQAYSELFYFIAKCSGIKSEIISGNTRDDKGNYSEKGHAWVFAYTNEDRGILLDPTWGAGSVDGNTFTRRDNCWIWFNVPPEWMILSHFPEEEEYQLIDRPMTLREFKNLSCVGSEALGFGLDPKDIFEKARKHQLALPEFYSEGAGEVELLEFPQETVLKIGEYYRFKIRMKCDKDFTLINNKLFVNKDLWKNEGKGVYSIEFMPREEGDLKFSIMHSDGGLWYTCFSYKIAQPNARDWKIVEEYYPLSIPEVKDVGNLWQERWADAGIDNRELLRRIREQHVLSLPKLFNTDGRNFKIVSVPMNYQLIVGHEYTFSFYPESGDDWVIINNDNWLRDWTISKDKMYSMTIIPSQTGQLKLNVKMKRNDKTYWGVLEYEVSQ